MKISEAEFTVFDVETTGLYPDYGDRICEIGAVRFRLGDSRQKKFHSLVDPERPISYHAFRVNGITTGLVSGAPTIDEVLPDFMRFIKGSVLVAYNAGFDLGFIQSALGSNSDKLSGYYIIDALRLARKLFDGIGRYSLENVSRSIGVDSHGQHRALADAFTACGVFQKELELLLGEGVESVEEIAAACVDRKKFVNEAIADQKGFKLGSAVA